MGRPILLGSVPSVIITIPCPPVRSRLPWAWVARSPSGLRLTASRVSAAMVSLPRVLPAPYARPLRVSATTTRLTPARAPSPADALHASGELSEAPSPLATTS